jgi:hypothetical protein
VPHAFDLTEYLFCGRPERRVQQLAPRDALFQRLRNSARLLVNLLEHEVAILSALHGVGGQFAFAYAARGGRARRIQDGDGFAANLRHVAFRQEHEAPRHRQQCSHVGGNEVFIDAEADDDGTAFACRDDAFGIRLAHHGQCIRAPKFRHRFSNRGEQISRGAKMMMDPVRDDFGVGLRRERVAQAFELGAQRFMIFDDAVMHDGDPAAR